MFIKDATTSVEVLNRTSELKVKAEKQSRIAYDAYNAEMINLSYRRTKPRGKERAKEIETIIENFKTSGREDITERNNFSRWFFDMGLVIEIDLIEEIARIVGYERFDSSLPYPIKPGGLTDRCLLYTSPSPRDRTRSRMPSSA